MRYISIILGLLLWVSVMSEVSAQERETCLQAVDQAVTIASEHCTGLGRNKVCYGNADVDVESRNRDVEIVFDAPGDQTRIMDIASMQLSALDPAQERWGIVLISLQAMGLDNTSPGQLVNMIAFGGTRFEPRDVTPEASMDDREGDERQVIDALQAFYFQSGIGTANCLDTPSDGLLIQSERGKGTVFFQMNGIDVALGSTMFVQSLPGLALDLYTLDGWVTIQVDDTRTIVPAGTTVSVPMTINSLPAGEPSPVRVYDPGKFALLPLSLFQESTDEGSPEDREAPLLAETGYVVILSDDRPDDTVSLKVTATRPWVETPIALTAGQTVTITATGEATTCANSECDISWQQYVGPEGLPDNECADCIVVGVPEMSLVGRVGTGEPFAIGTEVTFTVATDGVLYLAANDNADSYGDNAGVYAVSITIE